MMVRTQISLNPDELERAKARAAERGLSLAELIRQALRKELDPPREAAGISRIVGMIEGPLLDEGKSIDEYVADAIEADYERELSQRHLLGL